MKKIKNIIILSIKYILKVLTFIKKMVLNFLFFITIFSIFFLYFSYYKNETKNINEYYGALLLDLKGTVTNESSFLSLLHQNGNQIFHKKNSNIEKNSLFDIIYIIRFAKYDSAIKGLILKLDDFKNTDLESLEYIGKTIKEFKESKKPVYAVSNEYNQFQYYLASFCDFIYLNQAGQININGFSKNQLYFKKFLENLNIHTYLFRIGEYKSAIEPFMRNSMSQEIRQIECNLLNSLWNYCITSIAKNRNIPKENIFPGDKLFIEKIKKNNGNYIKYAIDNKLVDEIFTDFWTKEEFIKKFGFNKKNKKFNFISIYNYANLIFNQKKYQKKEKKNIAVITANGLIMNGVKGNNIAESQTIIEEIRKARLNSNIKGIILRINSPGGSVFASELIRNELVLLKKSNKPIVVSMGNIAASGGYWIATASNYIIGHPTTITGSIGIFGIIHTFEKSLNKIGIYSNEISNSKLSNFYYTKDISKEYLENMELNLKNYYQTFLKYVSESRQKNIKEIEKIARGRIWTGLEAYNHGLIDQLGNFDDAMNKIKELTGIKHEIIDWNFENHSFFENIYIKLIGFYKSLFVKNLNNNIYKRINNFFNEQIRLLFIMNDPRNSYALCIYCTNIY
ncbi:MAG: signal peptide peptidase SppA [Arsenophonus sp.]|nr:MAG: signal peptide peptidase SppA [Arsenophonus sp.]